MLAEVNRAELQVETCNRALGVCEREHTDLESRVRRLEAELAELREARIEAYSRWWETREARDRALHVARRLRRRLNRLQHRLACRERSSEEGSLPSGPVSLGRGRPRERRQEV
nr:hypothetical protein [Thermobifida halotolerans]